MKCQSCNCAVSSEFTFAFSTNCCPKCGKTMMQEDVQTLFLQIDNVMKQNGNDLGDLAAWLVSNFKPKTTEKDNDVVTPEPIEPEQAVSVAADVEITDVQPPKVKKPAPIKTAKDQQILSPERKNLFAKRAGVDKIKFETLVKDIRGIPTSEPSSDEDFDNVESVEFDETPLSRHEMQTVANLFDEPDSGHTDFSEIQKIQKLEQLANTGSIGKVRRST